MEGLYKRWKRTPEKIRKVTIFILGFTVVGLGLLFLPLPGPGWVIIFVGFAILGSEFEFAKQVRVRLTVIAKTAAAWGKRVWVYFVKAFKGWLRT